MFQRNKKTRLTKIVLSSLLLGLVLSVAPLDFIARGFENNKIIDTLYLSEFSDKVVDNFMTKTAYAADVSVDAAAILGTARGLRSMVWVSETTGYFFFIDADSDLSYVKTTNGGTSWNGLTDIKSSETILAFDVWYDKWTPGGTGDLIHIWYVGTGADDIVYENLNTASADAQSSEVVVIAGSTAVADPGAFVSGTKAVGGNLYVSYDMDAGAERGFYYSTNSGANWSVLTNIVEATDDYAVLFPANVADTNDIWALYHDASANSLTVKTLDVSANTASESSGIAVTDNTADGTRQYQYSGAIRHSDGALVFAVFNDVDTATADLLSYTYSGTTLTQRATIATNKDDMGYPSVFVDNATDDVYVAYIGLSDGSQNLAVDAGVYYAVSTDDLASWGSVDQIYSDGTGDWRQTWAPLNGPKFAVAWRDISSQQIISNAVNSTPAVVLGDGTDGSNSTVGPGASATEIGRFSLLGRMDTDTVTGMTVTLAGHASAYTNIATVGVYTTGDSLLCSSSSWGSDNAVELTSCGISVTTSPAEYVIKITPKAHADMPAVPGASYAVTATVTALTATNNVSGIDTNSATVTVDNLSPAVVTSATATAGNEQVTLAWTNPADADVTTGGTIVVLRRASSAVADVPVEGTTYTVGNTIGTATVACVVTGSPPTTNCTDTGLSNGTAYHYEIFSQDSRGNYDSTGVVPTGSPATPVPPISISGTCVQSDGVTPCNDVGTLRVAVGGVLQAQTDPSVDGSWSITGVTAPATGAVVTVFIDGAGDSDESAVITKYDGTGNISGMSMVAGTITIGSDDAATISNADIGHYDGDQDEDLPYTSNSNTLSTSVALIMVQGTYTPAGVVDVGSFYQIGGTVNGGSAAWNMGLFYQTAGTFNSTSGTLTLEFTGASGNIFTMTGGTFNHNNGTVLFDSYDNDCGSGFDYTFDVATSVTFYNLTIDQASDCVWSRTEVATGDYLVVNNILNLIDGSISGDFRIASTGNLTVGAAFNSGGNVTFTGSSAQTYTYSNGGAGPFVIVDKTGGAVTPSGATNMNMVGLVVSQGSFTAPTGTLTFTGYDDSEVTVLAVASGATFTHNGGTIYLDIDDNNCSFPQYYSFDADSALTIGSLTIDIDSGCVQGVAYSEDQLITVSGNLTLTNGQITDSWVVQGNYVIGASFDGGDAAITMTGTNAQNLSDASTAGMPTGDLTINKASGTVTMVSNADVMGSLLITSGTFDQGASYTLGVGAVTVGASGVWTNTGTGDVELYGNVSNAGTITLNSGGGTCGDADGITLTSPESESRTWSGAGTFNITDVTVSWMSGTITAYSSTNGGNNSGWTFEDCPAVGITISGTISTSGGALDCSTGGSRTVRVKINGAGDYTGTCSLNTGAYAVSSVVVEGGEILTIYIDGATEKAVRVTKPVDDTTAISNADLYQNYLAISHENAGPVTNSNLALYDSTDDADVFFAVADSVLTMESGTTLFIEADKTFGPVGDVNAVNIVIDGTLDASTSNPDITLTGNLTLESGSTYTKGTGEIIFAGGAAQTITDSNSSKQDLGNVRIMEGAGGGEEESDWWNASWTARRKVTIDNSASSENLVDFPFLVKLDATNFDFTKTEGWGGAPTVVTDDFNRGSLGADWDVIDSTGAILSSNRFTCSDFEWCGIAWAADTFSENVYVQANMIGGGTKYVQLSGPESWHGLECYSGSCNLFGGYDGSEWNELYVENIFSFSDGDLIRLQKNGSKLRAYKNGVEQFDYDSQFDTTGVHEVSLASYSEGILDNFEAGDVEQFGSGADLRFIDADGITDLPYEIEMWDPANDTAYIWVKVPQIDSGSTEDFFWMYYDNSGASYTSPTTFSDDFNRAEGPLGIDWLSENVEINDDGEIENTGADSWGYVELIGDMSADQSAEMQILSITTSARAEIRSGDDGVYYMYCGTDNTCYVGAWNNSTELTDEFFNFGYSSNDYVRIEAAGDQIRAYKNDVLQGTETNSFLAYGGAHFILEGAGTTLDNLTVEGFDWIEYKGRNPESVWSADYAGVWHVGQEDDWAPESVVGMHGYYDSAVEEVVNVTGVTGNGVELVSSDSQYIWLGRPSPLVNLTGSMTISGWVRREASGNQTILSNQGLSGNRGYNFAIDSSNIPYLEIASNSTTLAERKAGGAISLSTWYQVTGVYNASTQSIDMYVNGALSNGALTGTPPASQFISSLDFTIGTRSVYDEFWDGILDDIRISSTTRSADWIEAEYLSSLDQIATYATEEVGGGGGVEPVERVGTNGWSSDGTTGTVSVTVPEDADIMVVGAVSAGTTSSTEDLFADASVVMGLSDLTLARSDYGGSGEAPRSAIFYLTNPIPGDSVLAWSVPASVRLSYAFYKNVNTSDPIRSVGGQRLPIYNTSVTTGSLTAESGDMVTAVSTHYSENSGQNPTSWTNATEVSSSSASSYADASPSGNVTVTAQASSPHGIYSSIVVTGAVLRNGAASAGDTEINMRGPFTGYIDNSASSVEITIPDVAAEETLICFAMRWSGADTDTVSDDKSNSWQRHAISSNRVAVWVASEPALGDTAVTFQTTGNGYISLTCYAALNIDAENPVEDATSGDAADPGSLTVSQRSLLLSFSGNFEGSTAYNPADGWTNGLVLAQGFHGRGIQTRVVDAGTYAAGWGDGTHTGNASAVAVGLRLAEVVEEPGGGEEGSPTTLSLATNARATSVAINENATLDLNGTNIFSLSGNFTNDGTFSADTGTIALEGEGNSIISGTGPIALHHLTSTAAGKTIQFQAGKMFDFTGTLTLTGISENLISAESTIPGRQWLVRFAGEQSAVTYTSITDAGCVADSALVEFGTGMTTGGNAAVCWFRIPLETIRLQFGAGGEQVFSGGGDQASGGGSGGGSESTDGGSGGASAEIAVASSPAIVNLLHSSPDGGTSSGSTSSFTPSNNSLLVVYGSNDTGNLDTPNFSVSGGGLNWTTRVTRGYSESGTPGFVFIATAPVTTGASMTVTVNITNTGIIAGSSNRGAFKVDVVTGYDVSNPVETITANNEGGTASNSFNTTSLTPTRNGILFVASGDWNALGTPSSSNLTTTGRTYHHSGSYSGLMGYRTVSNGVSVNANVDGVGSGEAVWDWAQIIVGSGSSVQTGGGAGGGGEASP